jgi:hypothetical protein
MKKIILIVFLTCNISNILFSWDNEAAKYFPLSIGNSWTYTHNEYSPLMGCTTPMNSYKFKLTIIGDSIISGLRYFKFNDGSMCRIDSNSMNVYKRVLNDDCLTDSLLAKIGDSFNYCSTLLYLVDTNLVVFGGQGRRTRGAMIPDVVRRLMYGIGLYNEGSCTPFSGGSEDILKGCVIDGIVYGDTTTVPPDINLLSYLPLKVGNVCVFYL